MPAPPATCNLPAPPAIYTLRRRWLGSWQYWLCQGLGWGALASALFASELSSTTHAPAAVAFVNLAFATSGLFVSHLLRIILLATRNQTVSWRRFLVIMGPWVLATASAVIGALLLFAMVFRPGDFAEPDCDAAGSLNYLSSVALMVVIFTAWICLYLGYHYYHNHQAGALERMRLKAAVKEAELRTLKAQINPHFLFNSLNTLRALIPEELASPREAVTLLADLLRAALTIDETKTVPLAQELETVRCYLALERLRFEERLRVRLDISPAARDWPIPPFLLQTLVENAVKYGVGPRPEGADIDISAIVVADTLHLRVTNPGSITPNAKSTGMGLTNARARLAHLLGPSACLRLSQESAERVHAEITIPLCSFSPAPSLSLPNL
ncbi:MAG: histidine kinase [Opitutaceae bacterium]|nr:histidine kinase [Opitutaceae bacterium]